eukprot:364738-Chlamydomonas_euryale.AAC.5
MLPDVVHVATAGHMNMACCSHVHVAAGHGHGRMESLEDTLFGGGAPFIKGVGVAPDTQPPTTNQAVTNKQSTSWRHAFTYMRK